MEQENTILRQTGVLLKESAYVQCFLEDDSLYVPLREWCRLSEIELDGKWTVDILSPQTIVVDQITEYEFEWGTSAEITAAENQFINETPGALRIVSLEDNRRGTSRAQHILLRA